MTPLRILFAIALLTAAAAIGESSAQTRCQPTLARPCKVLGERIAPSPFSQLPERSVAEERAALPLPRLKLDNNTTMGVGVGSGVLGLESKF
jgi:hypothetical protein